MKLLLFFLIGLELGSKALLTGYNFNAPVSKEVLPEVLHEISGLAIIDSNTIACIQDENGTIFFYDTKLHKVKREIVFGLNGDYEGITLVKSSLFILRSDGLLFEIINFKSDKFSVKTYATQVPALNNEGLCYNPAKDRLLIGAKGKINNDPLYKDSRFIYGFDLKTNTLNKKPVFQFNINDINISAKRERYNFIKKKDKKGRITEIELKLNISEIAIHPITNQLYVLSATDHCLFTFEMNGKLSTITSLNPILFNKAEGLSFFSNGDLIVSNEGEGLFPTLMRFNYKSN